MNRKQRKEKLQKIAQEHAEQVAQDTNEARVGNLSETEREIVDVLNQIPTGYPALDEEF